MTFTDADLSAYLESSGSAAKAAQIESALASDPKLEDRLMALDVLAVPVRDAIKPVGKTRSFVMPSLEAPKSRYVWPAVAAMLGVLLIYTVGFSNPRSEAGWMDQVATYQALYSPDTIAMIEPSPAALDTQFARVSEILKATVPQQVLEDATDLTLLRAQVLAFEGKPLAQIVFSNDAGLPVALCLIQGSDIDADVVLSTRSDLQTASFSVGGFDYLLVGDIDAETTQTLATQFLSALKAG